MHSKLALKLGAGLLSAALLAAACGDDNGDTAAPGPAASEAEQSQTPSPSHNEMGDTMVLTEGAPALVQALTDLLDSHVYLASITVVMGVTNGLDSPEFQAAAETLDQNSQDLAGAIESVYGPEAGEQFLTQWRNHIDFFVQYTEGQATGNDQMAEEAKQELENYRQDFAAFLDSATGGELPADAAADALQMHVNSLIVAIDAAVAGDVSVFTKVYEAATGHMPGTASALAGAIATQNPEQFPTA